MPESGSRAGLLPPDRAEPLDLYLIFSIFACIICRNSVLDTEMVPAAAGQSLWRWT